MAKPEFPWLPASSSSAQPSKPPLPPFKQAKPSPRSLRPPSSPRILALLATFSVSPLPFPVYAQPFDPPETSLPFLYPPFAVQPTPSLAKRFVGPPTDAPPITAAPTFPTGRPLARVNLPDKYVSGSDGYWHKTEWSLYGSSQCAGIASPSPATIPLQHDANSPEDGNPVVPSFPDSDDLPDFDLSSLPTGWSNITANTTSHQVTVVVLVLSVALVVIIIITMFTCVFYRRKGTSKGDPERRRSPDIADDDSSCSIGEAKAAQRKWSRAAGRWRDNIRFAARRRRTNRALAPAVSYTTLVWEEERQQEVVIKSENSPSPCRSPAPTLTQRTSTSNRPDVPTASAAPSHPSSTPLTRVLPPPVNSTDIPLSSPVSPSQPPAYQTRPTSLSPEYTRLGRSLSSSSKAPISSHTPSRPHGDEDSYFGSGHVATDDKAILSHRAALASAPPGAANSHLPQLASVPSLVDDDMFELPSGSRPSSPNIDGHVYEPQPPYSPPASFLPPPPSKGKQKYDYTRDLDISVNFDIVTIGADLGPSAPPFEEAGAVPSAPPFDSDVPVPSAPPMSLEDFPDAIGSSEDDVHNMHHMDADALPVIPRHATSQITGIEEEHVVIGATPAPDEAMPPPLPPPPLV
ncbi:hypothetical protein BJV78DRAFT_1284867 [Lactifluus subvellereus]|nr:hypothetical protein BJV78DRAFT_1284867 [Lactifluus subvellereus]